MEITECIRTKIEELRQKKLARHASESALAENIIRQLNTQRSSLFEQLENELQQKHASSQAAELELEPENETWSLESDLVDTRAVATSMASSIQAKLSQDPQDESIDAYDSLHEVDDPVQSGSENHVSRPCTDTSSVTRSPTKTRKARVTRLREAAAETDVRLQAERAYLQTLRAELACSLASIEKLEDDLCEHSETWEAKEKDRLSIDSASTKTSKRKREVEATSQAVGHEHKKTKRVAEALGWMSLGSGLYYAGKACNLI